MSKNREQMTLNGNHTGSLHTIRTILLAEYAENIEAQMNQMNGRIDLIEKVLEQKLAEQRSELNKSVSKIEKLIDSKHLAQGDQLNKEVAKLKKMLETQHKQSNDLLSSIFHQAINKIDGK